MAREPIGRLSWGSVGQIVPCMASWAVINKPVCRNILTKKIAAIPQIGTPDKSAGSSHTKLPTHKVRITKALKIPGIELR